MTVTPAMSSPVPDQCHSLHTRVAVGRRPDQLCAEVGHAGEHLGPVRAHLLGADEGAVGVRGLDTVVVGREQRDERVDVVRVERRVRAARRSSLQEASHLALLDVVRARSGRCPPARPGARGAAGEELVAIEPKRPSSAGPAMSERIALGACQDTHGRRKNVAGLSSRDLIARQDLLLARRAVEVVLARVALVLARAGERERLLAVEMVRRRGAGAACSRRSCGRR